MAPKRDIKFVGAHAMPAAPGDVLWLGMTVIKGQAKNLTGGCWESLVDILGTRLRRVGSTLRDPQPSLPNQNQARQQHQENPRLGYRNNFCKEIDGAGTKAR